MKKEITMREKVKVLLPTFEYEKIKKIDKILKYCEVESENLNEVAESFNEDDICCEEDHCHYLKYSEATPESVALELIYNLYNVLEHQSKNDMNKEKLKNVFDNFHEEIFDAVRVDLHIACFSYPNCDIDPNGCRYQREDPEPYGHRD
jgi:hypothetical protein